MLGSRPTRDLVILAFTATVCLFLIVASVSVAIGALIATPNDPALDAYIRALSNVVSVVVGALLGLVAGNSRTGRDVVVPARPE